MRARYLGILGVILVSTIGLGAATLVGPGLTGGSADSAALAQTNPTTADSAGPTDGPPPATETVEGTPGGSTATPSDSPTETATATPGATTATARGGDGSDGGAAMGGSDGGSGSDDSGQTSAGATTPTATATSSGTSSTTATPTPTTTPTTGSQSTGTPTPDAGRNCLPNPYDYDEEDAYDYDEYGLGMPDRFAEDVLETDGVAALYYGMEGYQAGIAHYAEPESGADPAVYCEVGAVESYVYTEPERAEDEFTPHIARWTADPTYEKGMGISDQSVRWLLEKDHVERVEYAQSCTAPDAPCTGSVTVYVRGQYPPREDEYAKLLPNRIDGHDVAYESVDGGS